MADRLRYFICANNRSGGSWLASMLNSTGQAGVLETFGPTTSKEVFWTQQLGETVGIRCNYGQMEILWPLVPPDDQQIAKMIWIQRRNRWLQALSQQRAEATGVWHLRRDQPIPEAHRQWTLDVQRVKTLAEGYILSDACWAAWFMTHGKRPLFVCYEDMEREPVQTVRTALHHLGVQYDGPIDCGELLRSRDVLTEQHLASVITGPIQQCQIVFP